MASSSLSALDRGDFPKASLFANRALKYDPADARLHFLNAVVYHFWSGADPTKLPLAVQGYELAVRFDPGMAEAWRLLGHARLEGHDAAGATRAFAQAAILAPDDTEILADLGRSAYASRQPEVAAAAIEGLQAAGSVNWRVDQLAALTYSALGDETRAQAALASLGQRSPPAGVWDDARRRVRQWAEFHASLPPSAQAQPAAAIQPPPPAQPNFLAAPPARAPSPAPSGPLSTRCPQYSSAGAANAGSAPIQSANAYRPSIFGATTFGNTPSNPTTFGPGQPAAALGLLASDRMVIVDVVIIDTEETVNGSMGVNLLNGLALQFGGPGRPGLGFNWSQTTGETRPGGAVPTSESTAITSALTMPAVTYSLNVANSNSERSEILARPTLAALDCQPSNFFSGVQVQAAAVSGGALGGSAVQINRDIGVSLSITPAFTEDGRVVMSVRAERTFLRPPSNSVEFSFRLETSKTNIDSTVVMNFGDTLILSGLSEKETGRIRDGVPGFQEIPGLQYLTSRRQTLDFQKSVLILVTPRRPQYLFTETDGTLAGDRDSPEAAMRARYGDWFKPYPNWASVFHHLEANTLYREFRTGDVSMDHWSTQESLGNRLKRAFQYLYY